VPGPSARYALLRRNDLPTVLNELDLDYLLAAPAATGIQECVLLIEDDKDAMLLVRYSLQTYREGRFRLKWAESLSEGLEQLSKGGVDIVLIDLGLPDSSGPASYLKIRKVAPNMPVIVLTSDAREETEFAVTASGVVDYLLKDQISGERLVRVIHASLFVGKHRQRLKATDTIERLERESQL